MFEGLDVSTPVRVLGAIIILIALLGAFFWLVRRFGGERLGTTTARGRQPRLAVIDAATVDGRRRLVLIRRDNVEHLLMIGGPSDLVVEPNIVRAAAAPREAAPARPSAAPDALPRAVPLGEGSMWPLQPEPAPVAREPATRESATREPATREPATREPPPLMREPPAREPAPRPPRMPAPPPVPEETAQWPAEPEAPLPSPPPPQRERARPRVSDPLAGLADELSRAPTPPEASETREPPPPRLPPRREPRAVRSQPVPPPAPPAPAPDAQFNSAADQNLAEMAQRLEAALRRPPKTDEARFTEAAPARSEPARAGMASDNGAGDAGDFVPGSRAAAQADGRAARSEPRPSRNDKPAGGKSLYDSLEQEMASLLGRPDKKT
jgi:flagellar protein FliO/FliZ